MGRAVRRKSSEKRNSLQLCRRLRSDGTSRELEALVVEIERTGSTAGRNCEKRRSRFRVLLFKCATRQLPRCGESAPLEILREHGICHHRTPLVSRKNHCVGGDLLRSRMVEGHLCDLVDGGIHHNDIGAPLAVRISGPAHRISRPHLAEHPHHPLLKEGHKNHRKHSIAEGLSYLRLTRLDGVERTEFHKPRLRGPQPVRRYQTKQQSQHRKWCQPAEIYSPSHHYAHELYHNPEISAKQRESIFSKVVKLVGVMSSLPFVGTGPSKARANIQLIKYPTTLFNLYHFINGRDFRCYFAASISRKLTTSAPLVQTLPSFGRCFAPTPQPAILPPRERKASTNSFFPSNDE